MTYEIHPYAELFPQMTPDEWETFVADIEENGVRVPVVLYHGKILDGRHRQQAIEELRDSKGVSIDFNTMVFLGTDADALRYVYSANLHRRHLTTGQRACVGVEIKRHLQESIRQGQRTDLTSSNSGRSSDAGEIAADTVNVSRASIYKAEKLQEEAPDLFERVAAGEMPLTAAETALAVRNGTQTPAQAVKAVVAEIVASAGVENVTEAQLEKVARVLTKETTNVHVSDDSYEWYTPAEIVGAAQTLMGAIELDPASSEVANGTVKAKSFFTKEDDGLSQEWAGRVWLNPPYCMPQVQQFCEKAVEEYESGRVTECLILVNNATDTAWFHYLLSRYPVCFPKGRLHFFNPRSEQQEMQTRQGQAIFYLAPWAKWPRFVSVFSTFGTCLRIFGKQFD
jgi:phage N-6-adenine-methyltransferase